MALATGYHEGDDMTRQKLREKADFFPMEIQPDDFSDRQSMIIRVHGEIFLVEDTSGGEIGVFSLLLPFM